MTDKFQLVLERDFNHRGTERREPEIVELKGKTLEEAKTEARTIISQVEAEKVARIRSGAINPRIQQVVAELEL
ncbi:hypothetical protein COV82_04865 [Candidatus Peregrinibacteria bacterium CG11_big_fil_rev_8_21_14_0_20_46_8]|nr:MAG: hypothetical protein COV82_04865 [Candidatus Peregrinibacteria bacterium CG11_big_fil_rev_8_21_14_0_20_46_8]